MENNCNSHQYWWDLEGNTCFGQGSQCVDVTVGRVHWRTHHAHEHISDAVADTVVLYKM